MSQPTLSPALLEIMRRRKDTRERAENLHQVHQTACEREGELKWKLEQEHAKAYTAATGTNEDRKQAAIIATSRVRQEYYEALGVKRYAKAAIDSLDKDAELLTAALHAHNRELKTLEG